MRVEPIFWWCARIGPTVGPLGLGGGLAGRSGNAGLVAVGRREETMGFGLSGGADAAFWWALSVGCVHPKLGPY
ncbi:hypothetical protein SLA2020_270220 [Shorea laevis]